MDRYGIHRDCPIIWVGDWDRWHERGWRFECNLPVGRRVANCLGIRALQRKYGDKNVTLGHAMCKDGPFVSCDLIGVYVRDVELLVADLYVWMDAWGS